MLSPVRWNFAVRTSETTRWESALTETQPRRAQFWNKWRIGNQLEQLDQWPSRLPQFDYPTSDLTIYRVNWSITWHTLACQQATRWYNTLKVVQIVAAALIPVLTGTAGDATWSKVAIASLGGLIVILEGVQQLKKYGQNAVLWAQGKEALKREYYLYEAHAGVYSGSHADQIFADRIEQIIGNEVGKWADRPSEQSYRGRTPDHRDAGPAAGDAANANA